MDSSDALSRSRYREWRLNNVKQVTMFDQIWSRVVNRSIVRDKERATKRWLISDEKRSANAYPIASVE